MSCFFRLRNLSHLYVSLIWSCPHSPYHRVPSLLQPPRLCLLSPTRHTPRFSPMVFQKKFNMGLFGVSTQLPALFAPDTKTNRVHPAKSSKQTLLLASLFAPHISGDSSLTSFSFSSRLKWKTSYGSFEKGFWWVLLMYCLALVAFEDHLFDKINLKNWV